MQTSALEDIVVPVVLTTFASCVAFTALLYLVRVIESLRRKIFPHTRFIEAPHQLAETPSMASQTRSVPLHGKRSYSRILSKSCAG